jgi:hypothetical protein
MKSIHTELHELQLEQLDNNGKVDTELDGIEYDLNEVIDAVSDILELINSQDRAPKKKIKPLIKKVQSKLLDIDEQRQEAQMHSDNADHAQTELIETAIERLNAIDALYNNYKHYKMLNIEDFLDELDKLIY